MRDNIKIPFGEQAVLLMIFVVILCAILNFSPKHSFQDKDYVQAIVGEASNQSEDTMICIAHALRNRGTLKGVNGYRALHIWREPKSVWKKAWEAWDISAHEKDVVNGDMNFGTDQDLTDVGIDEDTDLIQCGDFYFY